MLYTLCQVWISSWSLILIVVVLSLSRVQLFATPWTEAHQASLSFTVSQSLLKFVSIESVMPYNLLVLCCPLLLLPSIFPSWHKANGLRVCFPSTAHSATVVTIKDEDENKFVSRLMRENNNITMRVWLGLSQLSAGKYLCVECTKRVLTCPECQVSLTKECQVVANSNTSWWWIS